MVSEGRAEQDEAGGAKVGSLALFGCCDGLVGDGGAATGGAGRDPLPGFAEVSELEVGIVAEAAFGGGRQ